MAGWVQKLLGGRSQARSPRDLLADAMADFANADLATQALRFYDTPQAFEIFLDETRRKLRGATAGALRRPRSLPSRFFSGC